MAKKRKRSSSKRRRGTMASVRRGGAPVSRASWRASGYSRNPKKRRYRRNPGGRGLVGGLAGTAIGLGKMAVATMAGQALGRIATNAIPIGGTSPVAGLAKGLVVAIGIKKLGSRVVSADLAECLAVGALMGPLRDAVVSYVPQAGQFLGAYAGGVMALPSFPGSLGAYGSYASVDMPDSRQDDPGSEEGMGAYAEQAWQQ